MANVVITSPRTTKHRDQITKSPIQDRLALSLQSVSTSTSSLRSSPVKGDRNGQISIRVDQPVEGSEVTIHAFYRSLDGDINEQTMNLSFSWLRSSLRQACVNMDCRNIGNGIHLAKAEIECVTCIQLGLSRDHSCFCSIECFKTSWKQHKIMHEKSLKHPSSIGSKLDGFGFNDGNKDYLLNIPQRKQTWVHMDSSKTFTPTKNDVGHILRVECRAIGPDGEVVGDSKYLDTNIVLPIPPMQPERVKLVASNWRNIERYSIQSFTVLSYNILAEIYATRQMYPYCPLWALKWDYRKHLLIRELKMYDADILCFQEAQEDHFDNFLKKTFYDLGYDGHFKQKTREAMGFKGKVDGCALFYKRNKFILRENYTIEFNNLAQQLVETIRDSFKRNNPRATVHDTEKHKAQVSRILNRFLKDNIAQVVVLERKRDSQMGSSSLICVANTHIFSNPEFPDVKLWQTSMLSKELEKILRHRNIPLILCGDFNSEPSSAVYAFLDKSQFVLSQDPSLFRNDASRLFLTHGGCSTLSHSLDLTSAYSTVVGREPSYTNYTGHWIGTVDYIWYSQKFLRPLSTWRVHDSKILEEYAKSPLPNCQFLSDHVPLCIEFALVPDYS